MKYCLILIFLMCNQLMAHNSYFLPGDAFFHTRITEKKLTQLIAGKDAEFTYERPNPDMESGCGYAGYSKIVTPKITASIITNLKKIYKSKYSERIFREQPIYDKKGNEKGKELIEVNQRWKIHR